MKTGRIILLVVFVVSLLGGIFLIFSQKPAGKEFFYDFYQPEGIALDTQDNVYLADTLNNRVMKFSSTGNLLLSIGLEGSAVGQLKTPRGIAVEGQGNFYVADSGNNRIQKFDSQGRVLGAVGSVGNGDGQFNNPTALALDAQGNVYVVDSGNSRVQKLDPNGRFLTKWGSPGTASGQFSLPNAIAIDQLGTVYVSDKANRGIQKFDTTGKSLGILGVYGTAVGQFSKPSGLAVDRQNNLYVVDPSAGRFQKFDSKGTYVTQYTCCRDQDTLTALDTKIVAASNGGFFLADTTNSAVRKLSSSGTSTDTWEFVPPDDLAWLGGLLLLVAGVSGAGFIIWTIIDLVNKSQKKNQPVPNPTYYVQPQSPPNYYDQNNQPNYNNQEKSDNERRGN